MVNPTRTEEKDAVRRPRAVDGPCHGESLGTARPWPILMDGFALEPMMGCRPPFHEGRR